jgi:peptidase E
MSEIAGMVVEWSDLIWLFHEIVSFGKVGFKMSAGAIVWSRRRLRLSINDEDVQTDCMTCYAGASVERIYTVYEVAEGKD